MNKCFTGTLLVFEWYSLAYIYTYRFLHGLRKWSLKSLHAVRKLDSGVYHCIQFGDLSDTSIPSWNLSKATHIDFYFSIIFLLNLSSWIWTYNQTMLSFINIFVILKINANIITILKVRITAYCPLLYIQVDKILIWVLTLKTSLNIFCKMTDSGKCIHIAVFIKCARMFAGLVRLMRLYAARIGSVTVTISRR